jgi:hypothetical protein
MQFVFDRTEPRRPFRVVFAHAVQVAVRMGHEGDGHGRLRLR